MENDTIRTLYEASLNGSVNTLNTLIQMNPLILSRVSLSPFSETPLHIAALLGHLEFCQVLLERKPSLASEVDSEGRCPLHLASAEGHTEVVEALLLTNPDVCLALDKDDKLPLHLAAMRGRMGAIKELTSAMPDSIRVMTDDGHGTVLHLCVRYNHLEALKFLLQSVRGDQQLLMMIMMKRLGNSSETYFETTNSVFFCCLIEKLVSLWGETIVIGLLCLTLQTIKYLLSLPEMRTVASTLNSTGFTPLDVLERCPRDFISLTIEHILIEAGVLRSADIMVTAQQPASPSPSIGNEAEPYQSRRKKWENFWAKYLQYQGNWIEEARGTLMVVATVIATMTFQSIISPPGGVWQEDTLTGGRNCATYGICEAGTAVVAYARSHDFLNFMRFNTTSFFSSLGVVLLLISGFPLKNRVMMWVLTIAMTVAVTFMALTYRWAQDFVTPDHILQDVYQMGHTLAGDWGTMLVVIGLIHMVRLVFWVKKTKKSKKLHVS